jgi:hypothetical protein
MQDSAKYLIHADIRASGVVERSDVVGAIFGQTEGLLGDELDLRDLQESSKVGRIDVQIDSEAGRSFGTVTIASGLDRVETAVLAAGLETIDRVGPCRAEFEVSDLEDARAAKRREIVDRAQTLLADLEETTLSSRELVDEVRRSVRVEGIADYEGFPAGPRVADSDAIVVVEGRADVLQLLRYGIKNAVAVEGTDVPPPIADLTRDRTVTAFLDGDRGGDLIYRELAQVGSVDYVTFAPAGESVEDLSRDAVFSALRRKIPVDQLQEGTSPRELLDAGDGPAEAAAPTDESADSQAGDSATAGDSETGGDETARAETGASDQDGPATGGAEAVAAVAEAGGDATVASQSGQSVSDEAGTAIDSEADATETPAGAGEEPTPEASAAPETLAGHADAVVVGETGLVRLLDDAFDTVTEGPAEEAFEAIETAPEPPAWVVLDGELSQRVLDVAAQTGVEGIVARSEGEFVKRPTSVRVRTAEEF